MKELKEIEESEYKDTKEDITRIYYKKYVKFVISISLFLSFLKSEILLLFSIALHVILKSRIFLFVYNFSFLTSMYTNTFLSRFSKAPRGMKRILAQLTNPNKIIIGRSISSCGYYLFLYALQTSQTLWRTEYLTNNSLVNL